MGNQCKKLEALALRFEAERLAARLARIMKRAEEPAAELSAEHG